MSILIYPQRTTTITLRLKIHKHDSTWVTVFIKEANLHYIPDLQATWDSNAGIHSKCYCILDVLSINGLISNVRYFNWRLTAEEMKEDLFQCITEKADFIWIKICSSLIYGYFTSVNAGSPGSLRYIIYILMIRIMEIYINIKAVTSDSGMDPKKFLVMEMEVIQIISGVLN
ncbi:hypothetical protein GLOIN_2v1837226 [Rhizophagus irregularis DAOM 181602=DAOM 197198]|nr:hypothetical protein GLOIN_2v1837226 [Rhizophagus irregularis DAOM 181602=DAOM 197198]